MEYIERPFYSFAPSVPYTRPKKAIKTFIVIKNQIYKENICEVNFLNKYFFKKLNFAFSIIHGIRVLSKICPFPRLVLSLHHKK